MYWIEKKRSLSMLSRGDDLVCGPVHSNYVVSFLLLKIFITAVKVEPNSAFGLTFSKITCR